MTKEAQFTVQTKSFCLIFLLLFLNASFADDAYSVNPGDMLRVFVWNEDTFNRDVLVGPSGTFRFPMVGEVSAGGSTAGDIEKSIAGGLANYLKDPPVVTVSLLSIEGNKIYVLGQVTRPGEYPVNRRIDVMQALALAGGLTAFAAENDIKILRRDGSGALVATQFSYAKLKDGKALDSNIFLESGDLIVVP